MADKDISLSQWCNEEFISIGQAFLAFWRNAGNSEKQIDELKLRFLVEIIDNLKRDTFERVNFIDEKPIGMNRWNVEFGCRYVNYLMSSWPRCSRNSFTNANPVYERIEFQGAAIHFPADIILRRKAFNALLSGQAADTPIDPVGEFRTGTQGRPSPIQLIEREAKNRREDGRASQSVTHEAKELEAWAKLKWPDAPTPTAKTIKNKISSAHNAWKCAQN